MNPLAITEEELTALEQACGQFAPIAKGGGPAGLDMRNSETGEYEVVRGALRLRYQTLPMNLVLVLLALPIYVAGSIVGAVLEWWLEDVGLFWRIFIARRK
jgi:hypothetical protein